MDHIRQIEALFSILMKSLELQISTLPVTGSRWTNSDGVNNIKQLLETLLISIESIEREANDGIERDTQQVLGYSASLVKSLGEVRKTMPEIQALKELCDVTQAAHSRVTVLLTDAEQKAKVELDHRYASMKNRVEELLSRIEKM